jgi:hypothetical protein
MTTTPTHTVRIYIAGPIEVAKQLIREHVFNVGLCVTVEPTTFIYSGGEEQGYVVGLVNYPRFPATVLDIDTKAHTLAQLLLEKTFQKSALMVTPNSTHWLQQELPTYREK